MPALIVRVLRTLGLLRVDLVGRAERRVPPDAELGSGDFVIVKSAGVRKWACLKCPGGCGVVIALSLNPHRRPRWKVAQDWLGRITVAPSVHQMNDCRCHFWIRRGIIEWCEGGRPQTIKR
jgi:Family of unknown function (DUF6527)